jgi:hypothetical protein
MDTLISKVVMKIIAILSMITVIAGPVLASPGQPAANLLRHRIDACSAPLIKFELALDAMYKAQDDYINAYASVNDTQEAGRAAMVKLEKQKTDATILFYRLIGATVKSIANLKKAEDVLNSDMQNLIEPSDTKTKIDDSQFMAQLHQIDVDKANIEGIGRSMNIALRIPASAALEGSSFGSSRLGGPSHVSFVSVLLARNDNCYVQINNEIQSGKLSMADAMPILHPIDLKDWAQQQREMQQAQSELLRLKKILNDPQK